MKHNKLTLYFLLFFIILGLSNLSIAGPKKLVGTWIAQVPCEFTSITFRSDGRFIADRGTDNMMSNVEGTYTVSGRSISLVPDNDPRMMKPVFPSMTLTQYRIKKNVLTFNANGNSCSYMRNVTKYKIKYKDDNKQ